MQKEKYGLNAKPKRVLSLSQRKAHNARDRARRAEKKKTQAKAEKNARGISLVERNKQASAKHEMRVRTVFAAAVASPEKPLGALMVDAGYSETSAQHPSIITKSELWLELLDKHLPNTLAMETHVNLLKASRVDHMTFIAAQEGIHDADINEMFLEIGCKVRKIIHRDNGARDVYFFMPDNKARAAALDMLYKLRTAYGADKAAAAFSLAKLAAMRDAPDTPLEDAGRNAPRLPRTA